MSDVNQTQPSASVPTPTDSMPYEYKPLGVPSLAYPGPGLPGHKQTVDAAAQRAQAAARWQAENNRPQQESAALAAQQKAAVDAASARTRNSMNGKGTGKRGK